MHRTHNAYSYCDDGRYKKLGLLVSGYDGQWHSSMLVNPVQRKVSLPSQLLENNIQTVHDVAILSTVCLYRLMHF